ncbi:MAG: 30S ribosomal protein S9 [Candidatus Omnitrophica bacterium]|nr:30S ribosomal protein S9 [Candidatus Omnitrophota bacterium]
MDNQLGSGGINIGRRKEAVARVKLIKGTGKILVNSRPLDKYFSLETHQKIIKQPLELIGVVNKYDIFANIRGGGVSGQVGALRLGIARALAELEPEFKDKLRKLGFLTRDPRMKERKKYGQKGARKRFQWTKR